MERGDMGDVQARFFETSKIQNTKYKLQTRHDSNHNGMAVSRRESKARPNSGGYYSGDTKFFVIKKIPEAGCSLLPGGSLP